MNIIKEIAKLNNITSQIDAKSGKITFFADNYANALKDLISRIAPNGKVAYITFASTHKRFGKEILSAVNGAGSKLVSLIMPEKRLDSVDYAGLLFNLPEDIRVVLVLDKELSGTATYYANIKKLPVVFLPYSVNARGFLDGVLYFKNGFNTDVIETSVDKYVIVDKDFILDEDLSLAFANLASKAVSLIDYRLYVSVSGEPFNKTAYAIIEKTLVEALKIFDLSPQDRKLALLLYSLKIQIANFLTGGKLIKSSAEGFSARILSSKYKYEDVELALSERILGAYAEYFAIKKAMPILPDYNGRAEKIARLIKVSEKEVINAFIIHTRNFYKDKDKYVKAINLLKGEAEKLLKGVITAKSIYLSLGGKPHYGIAEEDVKTALKYSGDTPFYFNGMTVLRELGVLDSLNF